MASSQCCMPTTHASFFACATGILVGGITIGYLISQKFGASRVNNHVKLNTDKVVDTFDVEDLGTKKVFCRCWQSGKFPYCDGSHNNYNKCKKDNLGPLIITNEKAAATKIN